MQNKYPASTLETIDTGMYEWVDEILDLHTKTNRGIYKVPTIWLGTERVWQIKNDVRFRDKVGKLILPIISINRDSVVKDSSFKGSFQAHIFEQNDYKGGAHEVSNEINGEKTSNFQNNIKPGTQETGYVDENHLVVKNYYTSPIPSYVTINYSITIRTEYQQQMNDLLTPFITRTGQINAFKFKKDGHAYEAFIQQDYSMNNNSTNIGEEERMFETKVTIKTLGYLVGEGFNRPRPVVSKRESRPKIIFKTETIQK
jgi:hypothetical protein